MCPPREDWFVPPGGGFVVRGGGFAVDVPPAAGGAPPPTLLSIDVTPDTPSIALPGTQQMTATGTYDDLSTQDLTATATWSSGTPANATVSSTGLVTSVKAGTSLITAQVGAVSGSETVTVQRGVITVTHLDTSSTTTNGTVFDTPVLEIPQNALGLLFAMATSDATAPTSVVNVTGGAAWDLITSINVGVRRLLAYRYMNTGAATSSAVRVTYPVSQSSFISSASHCTNVDTSGTNGSGAIVATNIDTSVDNTGTATTINTTLPDALEHANNQMIVGIGLSIAAAATVITDAQFTLLGRDDETANVGTVASFRATATGETTNDTTWTGAANAVSIGFEVKSAGA